jgi:hypothetical protein
MITQCPQFPKTHQLRSSSVGCRVWEAEIRTLQQRLGSYRIGGSRPKHPYTTETRPNADIAISLLTLGTASSVHVANRTAFERMGLAATRRLESCMQLYEMK